jgi:hypothetical protein
MQPVVLPKSNNNRLEPAKPTSIRPDSTSLEKADLLVLVQYRLETVMAPVTLMQWALLIEGASALASILLVMLVLWYFVRKVDQVKNREPTPAKVPDPPPADTIAAS